jgi:hypothetical protein
MKPHEKAIAYMDAYVDEYLRLEPRVDFDPCVVGVGRRFHDTVLVYSIQKILDMYVAQGMEREDAEEHFEFNTIGGWLGEGTPIFMVDTDHYDALAEDALAEGALATATDNPSSTEPA